MADVSALLEELVRIPSVNADLGGAGERHVATRVAEELAAIGATVRETAVPDAGGPNVIGVLDGDGGGPTVVLEAHMDTVPAPERGLDVARDGRRMLGRGSCDAKGSLAAMLVAMRHFTQRQPAGTVVFAGVVDEEAGMRGSLALLEELPDCDGVIIGEPTSLQPVRACNGVARVRLVVRGEAAHTSKAHLGHNAVSDAARLVVEFEEGLARELSGRRHPLVGAPTFTVTRITGGTAPNVVPDRCEVVIDRRIVPGEDADAVLDELDAVVRELRGRGVQIEREEPSAMLPGVEVPADNPVVRSAVSSCRSVLGREAEASGVPYSTDACQLNGVAGWPFVVLGPGSIDQAHTAHEWVDLDEVEAATELYIHIVEDLLEVA